MSITDSDYNKGGYAKRGISREYVNEAHSRTVDHKTGKVYRGEAGKQLLRRKLEKQAYYERNGKK
jgi:hypothetical protein